MEIRNRNSFRVLWTVLIVLLALGLSACGGDDGGSSELEEASETGGSTSAGTLPDACTLLSPADVESILGGSANGISSGQDDDKAGGCLWIEPSGGGTLNISMWALGNGDDDWANEFMTIQASTVLADEEISGLGLKALLKVAVNNSSAATRDGVISLGQTIDSGF